jgi:hypothetical protein
LPRKTARIPGTNPALYQEQQQNFSVQFLPGPVDNGSSPRFSLSGCHEKNKINQKIKWSEKETAMKKLLIIFTTFLLVVGLDLKASAWIFLPDQGDTGWQTYTYTAGPGGFTGQAGFVVSNVIDYAAYSELLLDNLSQASGGDNWGFEQGNFSGFDLLGSSFADLKTWTMSALGNLYYPTQGESLADLMGLSTGVDTSGFHNATGQAGTVGSIMETAITLGPGDSFSLDWAFLGNDLSPWDDFALFYLKDPDSGAVIFSEGLAQIGSAPAQIPIPPSLLLLGSGLLGLLSLRRRAKGKAGQPDLT